MDCNFCVCKSKCCDSLCSLLYMCSVDELWTNELWTNFRWLCKRPCDIIRLCEPDVYVCVCFWLKRILLREISCIVYMLITQVRYTCIALKTAFHSLNVRYLLAQQYCDTHNEATRSAVPSLTGWLQWTLQLTPYISVPPPHTLHTHTLTPVPPWTVHKSLWAVLTPFPINTGSKIQWVVMWIENVV